MGKLKDFTDLLDYKDEYKSIHIDELRRINPYLDLGNGGSWCRTSSCNATIYKIATYKSNGIVNYMWDVNTEEELKIKKYFNDKYEIENKGNRIIAIGIFGIKVKTDTNRPIKKEIINHYKKLPCCVCGSKSDLVCDHKNDLYNDPRVLSANTQQLSDFQSLCNHCNLQKRQISKETRKNKKRYSALNIPMLKTFNVPFTQGDETLNEKDINAMDGTFWYDPIDFMEKVKQQFGNK